MHREQQEKVKDIQDMEVGIRKTMRNEAKMIINEEY